jgi:hypothetical protein
MQNWLSNIAHDVHPSSSRRNTRNRSERVTMPTRLPGIHDRQAPHSLMRRPGRRHDRGLP